MIRTRTFRSIAEVVVPETRSMSVEEWREFEGIITMALMKRPPAMRRQLGIFLRLLNVLSFLQTGHALGNLEDRQRAEFLASIENSKLRVFRRGFWGLRTLVFMGYYARAACAGTLGYAAAPRGWELRR
jgi:hypothetical protein